MSKMRLRIVLWSIALSFMLLVALWTVNRNDISEEEGIPFEQEPLLEESLEAPAIIEEPHWEEPQVPTQLLLPAFVAEEAATGEKIGHLVIPAIELNMPVIADATASNLNRAPALMKSSHMPGNLGNGVISGHRMYEFGSHFNRLDELRIGDLLLYENEEKAYHFIVEQITIVDPSEIWITMGDANESRLTLFSCTPIRIATHRLVVFAVLSEEKPKENNALPSS